MVDRVVKTESGIWRITIRGETRSIKGWAKVVWPGNVDRMSKLISKRLSGEYAADPWGAVFTPSDRLPDVVPVMNSGEDHERRKEIDDLAFHRPWT